MSTRLIPENPFSHLDWKREKRKRWPRRLAAGEVTELLEWAEGHPDMRVTVFIELGLYAGPRFSEVQALTWGQALGSPDLHVGGRENSGRHVRRIRPLTDSLQKLRAQSRRPGDQDRVLQGPGRKEISMQFVRGNWVCQIRRFIPDFEYHMLRDTYES